MWSRILLAVCSTLLISCSSSLKNIKHDEALIKESGILLTRLISNYPFGISIEKATGEKFWLQKQGKNNKSTLIAVSVPSGKYSISEIGWKNKHAKFVDDKSTKFTIEKGKVNYICDLGVYFKLKGKDIFGGEFTPDLRFVLPINLMKDTLKEFKTKQQKLAEKYSFTYPLASNCVPSKNKNAQKLLYMLEN